MAVTAFGLGLVHRPSGEPPAPAPVADSYGSTVQNASSYSDLVLWYRLGEASGTTATDEEGTLNGTYEASGVTYSQGSIVSNTDMTSVLLDGTSAFATVAYNAAHDIATGTLIIHFRPSDLDQNHGIWAKNAAGLTAGDLQIFYNQADDTLRIVFQDGSAGYAISVAGRLEANTNHTLAVVWGSSPFAAYLRKQGSETISRLGTHASYNGTISGNSEPIYIGKVDNTTGGPFYLKGRVQETQLYSARLGESALETLMQGQVAETPVVSTGGDFGEHGWQIGDQTGSVYYLAPDGNDGNPGTLGSPKATLSALDGIVGAGDMIVCRGGTYTGQYSTGTSIPQIRLNGSASNPIYIINYPGEVPVFDGGYTLTHDRDSESGSDFRFFIRASGNSNAIFRHVKVGGIYWKGYHSVFNLAVADPSGCRNIEVFNCTSQWAIEHFTYYADYNLSGTGPINITVKNLLHIGRGENGISPSTGRFYGVAFHANQGNIAGNNIVHENCWIINDTYSAADNTSGARNFICRNMTVWRPHVYSIGRVSTGGDDGAGESADPAQNNEWVRNACFMHQGSHIRNHHSQSSYGGIPVYAAWDNNAWAGLADLLWRWSPSGSGGLQSGLGNFQSASGFDGSSRWDSDATGWALTNPDRTRASDFDGCTRQDFEPGSGSDLDSVGGEVCGARV